MPPDFRSKQPSRPTVTISSVLPPPQLTLTISRPSPPGWGSPKTPPQPPCLWRFLLPEPRGDSDEPWAAWSWMRPRREPGPQPPGGSSHPDPRLSTLLPDLQVPSGQGWHLSLTSRLSHPPPALAEGPSPCSQPQSQKGGAAKPSKESRCFPPLLAAPSPLPALTEEPQGTRRERVCLPQAGVQLSHPPPTEALGRCSTSDSQAASKPTTPLWVHARCMCPAPSPQLWSHTRRS